MNSAEKNYVIYDLTRLVNRRNAVAPTGIDRVDLRWATYCYERYRDRCVFVVQVDSVAHLLPTKYGASFLRHMTGRWLSGQQERGQSWDTFFRRMGLIGPASVGRATKSKLSADFQVTEGQLKNFLLMNRSDRLRLIESRDLRPLLPGPARLFFKLPSAWQRNCLKLALRSDAVVSSAFRVAKWSHLRATKSNKKEKKENKKNRILEVNLYVVLEGIKGNNILYVNVSHHGISNATLFDELYTKYRSGFLFFVHDIIPVDFPEYVRAGDDANHMRRIQTILRYEPIIVCNSEHTANRLRSVFARDISPDVEMPVIKLGVEDIMRERDVEDMDGGISGPYFVYVSTIEPRKNHAMLLNVWRRIAASSAGATPKLVLVGRRGWEIEQVESLLDRSPGLQRTVVEMTGVSDSRMRSVIKGARALLFPSFEEGWGLPIVEAMTLGTPVICSDIPAFREAGGNCPEFIDPLDGPGWHDAILEYAAANSQRRHTKIKQIETFSPPTWEAHFEQVAQVIEGAFARNRRV